MNNETYIRILEAARSLARKPFESAAKKPNWNEAETVLAAIVQTFGDPGRLGGTKVARDGSRSQHPAVTALARLLGRTEDAVVLKVMNLRQHFSGGQRGMAHGSGLDRWAAETFTAHPDELVLAAELVASVVPGAHEVLDTFTPRPMARDLFRLDEQPAVSDGVLPSTTVLKERAERRGQALFRSCVLSNFSFTCAFCGLKSRMPDRNSFLLQASHIRPWKDSDDRQRLDVRNGFALCAIHDKAFDWGFLTVDADYRIVTSSHAREHYEPETRVHEEILGLQGNPILHPDQHFAWPGDDYLRFHRERIFERRFRDAQT